MIAKMYILYIITVKNLYIIYNHRNGRSLWCQQRPSTFFRKHIL